MPFDSTPVVAPPLTTADILDRAAEAIRKYGWCQHRFTDLDGAVCMAGAVGWATYKNPRYEDSHDILSKDDPYILALTALIETICPTVEPIMSNIGSVAEWNDAPDRTEDQVLAAFAATSARLRSRACS